MTKHYLKGMEISDRTLALDAIKEVGPGGNFLMAEHTVENLRDDLYLSQLWDRDRISNESGGKHVLEKAARKVKEILDTHQPTPLSKEKVGEMKKILKKLGLEKVIPMI